MLRIVALLGFLTAILVSVGFVLGGILGMTIALVIAVVINFVSYWYSSSIVIKIYGGRPSDNAELNRMVGDLAREAKLPVPKVYTIRSDVPNAFATGRNEQNAVVAITEGLLALNKEEIEAVVAHELTHIKNKDMLVSAMAATIAGAISYIAQLGYWSMFMGNGRKDESSIIGLILIIVFAPLAALLIRMAISRTMEYKADYGAAQLTKKPRALASALRKINDIASHKPLRGASATSHMWIVNPFGKNWFTGLFSTHPPMERRIKRLEDMEHRGLGSRAWVDD